MAVSLISDGNWFLVCNLAKQNVDYCFQQQSNIFSAQLRCSRPQVLHYSESEDIIHWLL